VKAALVVLSFAASALAQDPSAALAAEAACGPKEITFDAKQDSTQHPTPQPEAGKALMYLIEDLGRCVDCGRASLSPRDVDNAVVKVGIDGRWVGAGRGDSYLLIPAAPGDHDRCLNWLSSPEERSRAFTLANFSAEAGKIYYFRAPFFRPERRLLV
jgi:hypothetical protein